MVQVPLDGDILYGEALLSMQHITGENLPIRRGPGAQIPAGSQCHDGVLVLRVTQRAEDSTPARISRLARDAQVGAVGNVLCTYDCRFAVVHSFATRVELSEGALLQHLVGKCMDPHMSYVHRHVSNTRWRERRRRSRSCGRG